MSDTPETYQPIFKTLARYTKIARMRLIWERYMPVLAKGLLALTAFIITTYLGLWERVGDPWRAIAVLVSLAYFTRSVWRATQVTFPNRSDARRRTERDSGQAHRPLDTLHDHPALSAQAWPAHYHTALRQAENITAPKGHPALAKIDPYYLRYIAPAALLAASIYVAGFGGERLRYVLSPSWQSAVNPSKVKFEAWIDPPAYTGRPPIYFKDRRKIDVPVDSEFVVRASGAKDIPRPKLRQGWRSTFLPLKQLGTKSFEARADITKSARAEWHIGTRRQSWTLNVVNDLPPKIEILEPPMADKRDRLAFTYALSDDYGVVTLRMEMAELREGLQAETAFADKTEFANIALSSASVKMAENASAAIDLTKHILAGRKVIGRLVATDGRGQEAISEAVYFTVPDKIFVEPLAKAAVENRTLIMSANGMDYAAPIPRGAADGSIDGAKYAPDIFQPNLYEPNQRMSRAPAPVQRAALLIEAITDVPDRLFTDPTVYMGLRNVRAQIRYADSTDDLRGLPETLWKIALRAEFGILGTALEEMREAQAALAEGLARRAPQREIDTLFERYNLAVEAYTEELRRKAIEDGNFTEDDGGLQSVDEIEELLKLIEEANKVGDVEGARKALARLAEVLENMQIQLSKGGGGGEGGDGSGEGELSEEEQKALEELAETIGEQRDLQDETRQAERAEQDRQNGNDTDGDDSLSPEDLAERQAELEQLLDQLEEAIPDSFGLGDGPISAGEGEDPNGAGGEGSEQNGSGSDGSGQDGSNQEGSGQGNQTGEGQGGGGSESAAENDQGSGAGRGNLSADTPSLDELIGSARRAMRESRRQLGNSDLSGARQTQSEIIADLRRAGEALAEAANRGDRQRGEGQDGGEGSDPLGRQDGDGINGDNSEADIDTRDNATRSRELLDELRRRAAEQGRSAQELEYLERLLKRF